MKDKELIFYIEKTTKCPTCEKDAEEGKYFPFCSGRCKNVDLYSWLNGEYGFFESEPAPNVVEDNDTPDPFWRN